VTQGFQLRTPWLRDQMEGMRVRRAGWAQGKGVGCSAEQEVEVGSRDGAMTVQVTGQMLLQRSDPTRKMLV